MQNMSLQSEMFAQKWLNVFANKIGIQYYGLFVTSQK